MTGEFGYAGKILRVDLSSGRISHVPTMDYADRFLGGRGVAAKIYWDEVAPEVKALDPENRLIFITGPLAGVSPGVSGIRWLVCGKSPASDPEQFSYGNYGGSWGTELKFAGYDGIVVHGKAEKPVYISIEDEKVEIRNASALWGKSTVETRESLKKELGNRTRVVATGPAGENGVVLAILLADEDAAGTGGFGAVMGSKNLKAISVRGSGKITAADPARLKELNKYVLEMLPPASQRTAGAAIEAIPPAEGKLEICRGCGLGGCHHTVYQLKDGKKGRFACMQTTFYQVRAQRYYGAEDWSEVPFRAAMLTNEYGVDCNALEPMIMWLSRCRQAGILNDENTGIPLSKMGSYEFIETLIRKMSLREGFGDILAQGTLKAAALVGNGAEKLITDYIVKGGQHSAYNPRFYITTGIFYAMEPRQPIQQLHEVSNLLGAWVQWNNKEKNAYISTEVFRAIAKRFWGSEVAADFSTYEGKALAAAKIQDRQYAKESLILCDRLWPIKSIQNSEDHVGDPAVESKILSAVTGEDIDEEGLYRLGERAVNMQRAILVREARGSDVLPESHFTIPLKVVRLDPDSIAPGKDGETFIKQGAVLDREKFAEVTREFYQIRGWDPDTGLPTRAKLEELDMGDIADGLEQRGLLA